MGRYQRYYIHGSNLALTILLVVFRKCKHLLDASTGVPTKSDSDEIVCLQLLKLHSL